MRTPRPLLHLAALTLAVAVGAHLLMHVPPHAGDGAEPAAAIAGHGATAGTLAAAGLPDHSDGRHGHLKAALCMAVLAVAALTATSRFAGRTVAATAGWPVMTRRLAGIRLRAPPSSPGRVDAGVLLRV
jgi:hypothetical protein